MAWIILACLIIDQLSKYLVSHFMILGQSISVIDNVFYLTYVLNTGAGFSILEGARWFFVILTIIILAAVFFLLKHVPKSYRFFRCMIAVFVGGVLGNFIDRLLYGHVIDFFDFQFFPVFNIADCCLTVSVIIMCVLLLFGKESKLLETKQK